MLKIGDPGDTVQCIEEKMRIDHQGIVLGFQINNPFFQRIFLNGLRRRGLHTISQRTGNALGNIDAQLAVRFDLVFLRGLKH